MEGKRTGADFSKHILLETHYKSEHHNLDVWDLKLPNSEYTKRVRFINSCDRLMVSGDYGNWVFCREFHPSQGGCVSDGYWNEKLSILSEQSCSSYDSDSTKKSIKELLNFGLKEYGYEGEELKQAKYWFKELLNYVYDEHEYVFHAYRSHDKPLFLDSEIIPFEKRQHIWLSVVYDAFEELCRRSES